MSDSGGELLINSPAAGAELSSATYFSAQVVDTANITDVVFRAGATELASDAPGEDTFRRFLIPDEFPEGELELEVSAVGRDGKRLTQSLTVEIVRNPPASGVVGPSGATFGDREASGALSTVTIPPGAAEGISVDFEAKTQDEVLLATGVDYDSLGVTFLGAQKLTSSEPIATAVGITSGGFGPFVQPGQAVVNYAIASDADGDGAGELVVVNTASVAPNGDVVSDPIPHVQVADEVLVGTQVQRASTGVQTQGAFGFLTQATGLSGAPGTPLVFNGAGFNAGSALGNKAVFCSDVDDTEYEVYGIVRETSPGSGELELAVSIPPLPSGPATLKLRNESSGFETEVDLTIENASPLSAPAADIIDGYMTARIDSLESVRDQAFTIAAQNNLTLDGTFVSQLNSLIRNVKGLRGEFQKAYASSDPEIQKVIAGLASTIETQQATQQIETATTRLRQQVQPAALSCSDAEQLLSDALEGITLIDGTLAAGACVSALVTGIGAPACLFGATIFVIGTAIDYSDIIKDCSDDDPPPPPLGPPGGSSAASVNRSAGNTGSGVIGWTGMGGGPPPGGSVGGNVTPPPVPLGGSAIDTTALSDTLLGRYQIVFYSGGARTPFAGVTDASGYFFAPFITSGHEFIAVATDTQTGETRELQGIGKPVGESIFLTFDFTPQNAPPSAHAGINQSVKTGDTVALDASGSTDPEGDPLTYTWELTTTPTGSSASIQNADAIAASFVADVAGSYEVMLTVDDGILSDSDTITVTATDSSQNSPPAANAGGDQIVSVGAAVTLDGTNSSDPDGDTLAYAWSLTSVPSGSSAALDSATSPTPGFTVDIAGTYTAELTVSDGQAQSSDTVQVTAESLGAPIAFGESVSDTVDGEIDKYVFSGDQGQMTLVLVEQLGSSLTGIVRLFEVGGTEIGSGTFGGNKGIVLAKLPATGDYLIEVDGTDHSEPGAYTVSLLSPAEVQLNTNVTGTLADGETRYYAFYATAGLSLTTSTDSSASIKSRIPLSGTDPLSFGGPNSIGEVPQDGYYLLEVEAPFSAGSYTTGLAVVEPPTDLTFDGFGRAVVEADLAVVGDVQLYRFTGVTGDGLLASLRQSGTSPLAAANFFLLDSQGFSPILESTANTVAGILREYGGKLAASGDYLLKVAAPCCRSQSPTGTYQIRVERVTERASITVDDDLQQCSAAHTRSLPAGLFAVAPGGTVTVCSGTHAEYLSSHVVSDGVTITGSDRATTIVTSFGWTPLEINADGATVENLTIHGRDTDRGAGIDLMPATGKTGAGLTVRNVTIRPHPNQPTMSVGIQKLPGDSLVDNVAFQDLWESVAARDVSNVQIVNSTFQGASGKISLSNVTNALITGNAFEFDTASSAMQLTGGGFTVEQNTIRLPGTMGSTTVYVHEDGIGSSPSTVIRNNHITLVDNHANAIAFFLQPANDPADIVLEQNHVIFTGAGGGQAIDLYAAGNGTVAVRNNIFVDTNGYRAIEVRNVDKAGPIDIVNNTLRVAAGSSINNTKAAIMLETYDSTLSGALPVTIVNNILQGNGSADAVGIVIPAGTTVDSDYNLFHQFATKYAAGVSSTGGNELEGQDPMFTDPVLLTVDPSSPAVDAGASAAGYGSVPGVDYDGTIRPQGSAVDIGAHEQ